MVFFSNAEACADSDAGAAGVAALASGTYGFISGTVKIGKKVVWLVVPSLYYGLMKLRQIYESFLCFLQLISAEFTAAVDVGQPVQ